ncbi:unnamed protein product [Timema podura]|uniref:Uncharacterized protein n=1 Tax=Timema podura TaxID=61482 RepID=A0ABN7ND12_TIMPD|nr:unnamed protein product [Timema podura]
MGTCMGRCLKKDIKRPYCSQKTMYFHGQDHVEFDFLVDDFKADEPAPKKSGGFEMKGEEFPVREVTLELTDDTWSREDVNPRLLDTSASRMQSYAWLVYS